MDWVCGADGCGFLASCLRPRLANFVVIRMGSLVRMEVSCNNIQVLMQRLASFPLIDTVRLMLRLCEELQACDF